MLVEGKGGVRKVDNSWSMFRDETSTPDMVIHAILCWMCVFAVKCIHRLSSLPSCSCAAAVVVLYYFGAGQSGRAVECGMIEG